MEGIKEKKRKGRSIGSDRREGVEFPGEIWTVSFWLRPSLKSKNKKTTHTCSFSIPSPIPFVQKKREGNSLIHAKMHSEL